MSLHRGGTSLAQSCFVVLNLVISVANIGINDNYIIESGTNLDREWVLRTQ